ncbi:MAG: type VI secretion system baseplate subunit TssF [Gammaproteobacteria bacterium]
MTDNSYFKDELNFLYEARERAAEDFPDIARFLAIKDSDPDVERLFEGFAFLTGRLRQKLDDEFPEIIQSMLAFWWPHYLRTVPAMSILEFTPVVAAFSESKLIDKGTEVQSKQLDNGQRCRFQTTRQVAMHPLTLSDTEFCDRSSGTHLEISFDIWPNASFSYDAGNTLVFYIEGAHEGACDLYHFMTHQTASIQIDVLRDGLVTGSLELDKSALIESGFNPDESVIPNTEYVAPGYLSVQEYFCFPEKFRFVELGGLNQIVHLIERKQATELRITFEFDRQASWNVGDVAHPLKLNCVPIVNLFRGSAKPIFLDHARDQYRVLPESSKTMHCEFYSIEEVLINGPQYTTPKTLHAFESFDHVTEDEQNSYYRLHTSRRDKGNGMSTHISFVDRERDYFGREGDVMSLDIWCSNGDQPRLIDPGEINVSTGTSPEFAKFRNLTRPTVRLLPPMEKDLLWKLVSNMSINFNTLLNNDSLRNVLGTYDFLGMENDPAHRRTIRILRSLEIDHSGPADSLVRGVPVRGIASQISISRTEVGSLGEVFLFGCVIREFLSAFAGINSFHQLSLRERDSGEVFKWTLNQGSAPIL